MLSSSPCGHSRTFPTMALAMTKLLCGLMDDQPWCLAFAATFINYNTAMIRVNAICYYSNFCQMSSTNGG